MREIVLSVLTAACLAGACARDVSTSDGDAGAAIRTDRLEYAARPVAGGVAFDVPFTYTNRSADSVFLVNCQIGIRVGEQVVRRVALAMELEKRSGGAWKPVWGAITDLCLSPPVWVAPGASYTDTLRVFGGRPGGHAGPELEVAEVAGEYRLAWPQLRRASPSRRYPDGDTLPAASRTSNAFTVTGGW